MTESPPRGFLFFGGPWGPFFVCGTGTDGNEGDEYGHGGLARALVGAARAAAHAARVRARRARLRPGPRPLAPAALHPRARGRRARRLRARQPRAVLDLRRRGPDPFRLPARAI